MIMYFSGTGNSRYTAELIGKITDDEVVSLNQRLKNGDETSVHSNKPFVFVAPVYAGRIPRIVEEHLKKVSFSGTRQAYFVVTCAETPWRTGDYVKKLFAKKTLDFMGFRSVVMPQNYILMYDTPSEQEAEQIIKQAVPTIEKLAAEIKVGKSWADEKPGGKWMSSLGNPVMYTTMVNAKKFESSNDCIGCGLCVKQCPYNNISLVNNQPQWGNQCTHCMACINCCPTTAIEYGKKTKNRNRVFNKLEAK